MQKKKITGKTGDFKGEVILKILRGFSSIQHLIFASVMAGSYKKL
jgi:hypothetical protein